MNSACERLTVFLKTPLEGDYFETDRRIATTPPRLEAPLSLVEFEKECNLLYSCLTRQPSVEVLVENGKTSEQNLEARQYTFAHTIRVFHYALYLAHATDQPPQIIRAIGKAALCHDTGKSVDELVSVHDYKTDKLGANYNKGLMNKHVQFSVEYAQTAGIDEEVIEAIANHHERWDGSGYPNGISGNDISVISIILSLADIFDSAISKRPYNGHNLKNMSYDEIVTDLRSKLFDNSKFGQDKLVWFETLATTVKEKYAKELFEKTTNFAEEVINN